MPDQLKYLDILKTRNTPVLKDGSVIQAPSYLARLYDDGVVRAGQPSELIESDDSLMYHSWKISSPTRDRMGDVVEPEGCLRTLDNYKKNPQWFFSHKSNGFPVGLAEHPKTGEFKIRPTKDAIYGGCFFHGKTQESTDTYELVKIGVLRATSIGFRPLTMKLIQPEVTTDKKDTFTTDYGGLRFLDWELLEVSVVPIPCQAEALDAGRSWLGKNFKGDSAFHRAVKAMLEEDAGRSVTVSVPASPPIDEKSIEFQPVEVPQVLEPQTIAGVQIGKFTESEIQAALDHLNSQVKNTTPTAGQVLEGAFLDALKLEFQGKLDAAVKALESRLPASVETPVATKMDDLTPPVDVPEEILPESAEKKTPPLGAAVLLKLLRTLDEAYHLIEAKLPQIENKKTLNFLGETHDCLDEVMHKIQKFGGKEYPDFFPKASKDIEPEVPAVPVVEKAAPVPEPKAPEPAVSPWTPELLAKFSAVMGDLAAAKARTDASFYRLTGKKA